MRINNDGLEEADTVHLHHVLRTTMSVMIFGGGIFQMLLGPRMCCFIGSSLYVGGTLLTVFAMELGMIPTIVTYAVMRGIGFGMCFMCGVSCALNYMPYRAGLINTAGGGALN
eukprot:gene1365-3489_t